MIRILLTLLFSLALSLTAVAPAHADVRPEEMVSHTSGKLEFHYPQRYERAAKKLDAIGANSVARAERALGLEDLGRVEVWVLPEVDDYFEVTGAPGNPPKWAVGLSLSGRGVIIVTNGAGPQGQPVELEKTFEHELAHVAIDRARDGQPVPRWFNEGFALMHADEWTPERAEIFARAAGAGALKPFADIERTFPEHSQSAGLAYAQSLQFVMYLRRVHGEAVFADIMSSVRQGVPFDDAFRSAVGQSRAMTEALWRQDAESNLSFWSVLNDGTWGFVIGAILFIVAFVIRRRQRREKFAAMRDDSPEWDYDEARYPLPGK